MRYELFVAFASFLFSLAASSDSSSTFSSSHIHNHTTASFVSVPTSASHSISDDSSSPVFRSLTVTVASTTRSLASSVVGQTPSPIQSFAIPNSPNSSRKPTESLFPTKLPQFSRISFPSVTSASSSSFPGISFAASGDFSSSTSSTRANPDVSSTTTRTHVAGSKTSSVVQMTSEGWSTASTTRVGNSRASSSLDTSSEPLSTLGRTDKDSRPLPTESPQFQGEGSRTRAARPRPTSSSSRPGRVPFAGAKTTRAPRPSVINFPRPVVPARIPLSDLLSSLESALSNASTETATAVPRPITTRIAATSSFGPFIANASTLRPSIPTASPSRTLLTTTFLPTSATQSFTPPPPAPPVPTTQPTIVNPPGPASTSALESVSLPAATIGGITVGCAASFGLLVLLAFMIWRKRREQYRPSYLEASWGDDARPDVPGSHQEPLLEDHSAFRTADSALVIPPARSSTPPQPYVNPYYAVLAQRNPNVFGPRSPPPPKPVRINFKRRRSMFLLKGWERTRLSEIPEELEDPFDEKEPDFRRTVYEELGRFKFWESREELMEDGYREVADGEEYGKQDDEDEEREVDDMVDVQL